MNTLVSTLKGTIFNIQRYSIHDGPGIRTTVFLKGCPLRCWWCHNPEGLSPTRDIAYIEFRCIGCGTCTRVCPQNATSIRDGKVFIDRSRCVKCGTCAKYCPTSALTVIGREITVDELMQEIKKDELLYDYSGGGVTFSGGEPLYQPEFLKAVLIECKKHRIHVALDTSGYAPPEIFDSIAKHVDLFLFDIKLIDVEEHIKYTGLSNKVILRNLKNLIERGRGKDVVLRFPVIPGITDTEKNLKLLEALITKLRTIEEIDLLPFHDVSEKYTRLGMEYKMKDHRAPSEEELKCLKKRLEALGLHVKIGG